jgi:hypothetical protein
MWARPGVKGYVNKTQHNLHDTFLNMRQPASMVLSQNAPHLPGQTTHTMCPERFDALLHVWRSHTLMSLDGTRNFGKAALHMPVRPSNLPSHFPLASSRTHLTYTVPSFPRISTYLRLNHQIGHAALTTPRPQHGSAPPGHILSSHASMTRHHSTSLLSNTRFA